jgi:hypothetical protein
VLWSDNYVSLLPGESLSVTLSFAVEDACADGGTHACSTTPPLRLQASGWNVPLTRLALRTHTRA